ncbi:MAG TPA: glycosyltransferase family 4 protein [Rhodothermales bacterium]|nr:glycosyltransferase family 4 protein [Rhodothermales bacterium]
MAEPRRILVHDFGGYPFPLPMSRRLAERGHTVQHVYCASLTTTPNDGLPSHPDDPATFSIKGIALREPLQKFSFVKRWRQENEYGRLLTREVAAFQPDVVLSGNAPLDAQRRLLKTSKTLNAHFVFWVQDLIGIATHRLLRRKIPLAGEAVGRYYLGLERSLLQKSDAVIAITDDFKPILHDYGLPDDRVHVIENWALLDETPVRPKDNAWAQAHDLADKTCLLYSGTLGMKHNPDLLLQLALALRDRKEVRVAVVSQGLGADWLKQEKAAHHLDNLLLFDFQPFEDLPDVLGTADVLLAILEPDAGIFSVPSKVLTYLCAQRPLVLAVPPENLAAQIVAEHEAGLTVPPTNTAAFIAAARSLLDDAARRTHLGHNARRYAETTFDLDAITDAFERILTQL